MKLNIFSVELNLNIIVMTAVGKCLEGENNVALLALVEPASLLQLS